MKCANFSSTLMSKLFGENSHLYPKRVSKKKVESPMPQCEKTNFNLKNNLGNLQNALKKLIFYPIFVEKLVYVVKFHIFHTLIHPMKFSFWNKLFEAKMCTFEVKIWILEHHLVWPILFELMSWKIRYFKRVV